MTIEPGAAPVPPPLPAGLPVPLDDGAAAHLGGQVVPHLTFESTDGLEVELADPALCWSGVWGICYNHHAVADVVERSQVDGQGRVVVPARVRAAAGLTPGTPVAVRVSRGRVILEPLESIERKMWRPAAKSKRGDATAELLADRRREVELDLES